MLLQVILEGLGLGALLVLVCAVGICKGAVGMVHLYSPAVQQRCVKLGLTSPERIRRNSLLFKAVCIPGYIGYVLVCVYGINGAKGFVQGFWQLLVILSVMTAMPTVPKSHFFCLSFAVMYGFRSSVPGIVHAFVCPTQ